MRLAFAVVISVPILLLFVLSLRQLLQAPTVSGTFLVLGAGGLFVMALTHIFEGLGLFPSMGWGLRHSPGHYIDLMSTTLGIAFLVAASLCPLLRRRGLPMG